jgi:hypothetical protein
MGADQLLSTAWELVPYSFVVDWFLNTADFLAAWNPSVDVVPLTSWVTIMSEIEQTREITGYERGKVYFSNPTWVWDSSYGTHTYRVDSTPEIVKTTSKERIPRPERPLIPSLNIRLNVSKVLDLLALLRQLLVD